MTHDDFHELAVPLIIGIVQALKKAFKIRKRFVPLLSLALGICAGVTLHHGEHLFRGVIEGTVWGLAASGLYSGGKALRRK